VSSDNSPGPFTAHLGLRLVSADADGAVMEADPGAEHCNGGAILHGGYLSALLDSATGWAVHAADDSEAGWPHVQISVQFVRAALPGEPLVCTARCLSKGRRIATAEGEIRQRGRVVARATSTHAALRS
jgi:acyl-CoA thioesterase